MTKKCQSLVPLMIILLRHLETSGPTLRNQWTLKRKWHLHHRPHHHHPRHKVQVLYLVEILHQGPETRVVEMKTKTNKTVKYPVLDCQKTCADCKSGGDALWLRNKTFYLQFAGWTTETFINLNLWGRAGTIWNCLVCLVLCSHCNKVAQQNKLIWNGLQCMQDLLWLITIIH